MWLHHLGDDLLRELSVLCHICNAELHASGDFHSFILTCTLQQKHSSV